MTNEIFTFLVGGKAGEGVKKAGSVAAKIFSAMGRHIFQMDDYQSLIKGGHNFSVISTSNKPVMSHYMAADLMVSLDARSYDLHKLELAENGMSVYNSDVIKAEPGSSTGTRTGTDASTGLGIPMITEAKEYENPSLMLGVAAVATLAAAISFDKSQLEEVIKHEYPREVENNLAYADKIYDLAYPEIGAKFKLTEGDKKRRMITGNEAISLGAAAGGLDIYIAYPMTPSSSILHFLAAHDNDLRIAVMHPENEIAVANIAIGASFAGARTMVGSSGGGFALMQEAFSLAGMTETPLLCILASRPGPSTGVPTYTSQGDLRFALNQGHGDFPRIVASPGTIEQAFYLTTEMLNLVWRFQTPGILLTEKHLAESTMTVELDLDKADWAEAVLHKSNKSDQDEYHRYKDTLDGVSPLLFPPSPELIKWSSYEHDEQGITTEDPEMISRMHDKRKRKLDTIINHLKNMKTVNVYDFGSDDVIILTYGSTTMSVLEALRNGKIKATMVQPGYLEPFPVWELKKYLNKKCLVIEQSATGQFANLLWDKVRIEPQQIINQYDGRPFDPNDLASKLSEVV